MEKLYYEDTYKTECCCTVVEVNKTQKSTEVLTDKTVCYPECGGQPGDKGFLGQYQILDTKKAENGDSVLILDADCNVKTGDQLTEKLNWQHRYKYMMMHTAQHMLSGLLFTLFNIGTVSVHLGEEYLTIETNVESVSPEIVGKLVDIANQKIREAHSIVYHEMSHKEAEALGLRRSIKVDGAVRIVEIEDVDRIACGGVHVKKTSELNLILCIGSEQIRGHVRLYFVTGLDALAYVVENKKTVDAIRERFSCAQSEMIAKIDSIQNELAQLKKSASENSKKLAMLEIDKNIKDSIAVFDTDLDVASFSALIGDYRDLALCVFNKNHWLIALKGKYEIIDFNQIRNNLFSIIDAKGGGRTPMFQGVCSKPENRENFCSKYTELVKTV